MNIGAAWRESRSFFEGQDGGIEVVSAQGVERSGERLIRGVFLFLSERGGGNQAERG